MGKTQVLSITLLVIASFLVTYQRCSCLVSAKRMTYIVHMDKSAMPKAFLSHHHWYSSVVDSINSTSSLNSPEEGSARLLIYSYDNVLHGFSASLSEDELEALKRSPGFLSAYTDKPVTLDTTHTPEFLSLDPTMGLWPASNYGEDVIVGVIDTGVWPENPTYKDDGITLVPSKWRGTCEAGQEFNSSLCNLKLIGAQYFNKALRNSFPNISMDSARDTNGHGTHTSSTIAGNYVRNASYFGYAMGTARGVAPRARIAVYKVGWDEGIVTSDMVAGIDRAVADGVDIISMSLGIINNLPLYEDPLAIASFGAMEKGVLFSCAAGNSGPSLGRVRNGYPWVMTVAASTVDRWFAGTLSLGNGLTIPGWSVYPARANVKLLPLIYDETMSNCSSTELLSDARGIVICERPDSFFNHANISRSTVPATIFFSDDYQVYDTSNFPNAGVVLGTKYKQVVINYALNGVKPCASITFRQTILGIKPAQAAAAYSSRGPSSSYPNILKPDVMAPGTLILAAWVPNVPITYIHDELSLFSDFNFGTGTSMACPHASGVAALLKGAHPGWSPAAIRSAIMTTASTVDNTQSPIKDVGLNLDIASPLAMGAGQVNPNDAMDPGFIYDATTKDYMDLLCSMNLTRSQFSSITRSTTHDCSNPSSDLNYPSFIAFYDNHSTKVQVKTFKRTVTNVGSGATTYKVVVIAPSGSEVEVNPETLTFQHTHQKQSYSVTIKYARNVNETVSFGSLTWIEVGGKRHVKSPIVLSPIFTF